MLWLQSGTYTWRFVGSSKWSYKPFNMGYNYGYPTYKPTYNYPWTSKNRHFRTKAHTIWAHGPLGFLMSFLERHIWHQGAVRHWPCQYPGIQARLLHDAFRSETLGQHSRRTMFAEPLIPCIHTRLPVYRPTYILMYAHSYMPAGLHACMNTYMLACLHANIPAYLHACKYACMYIYIHVYMYI